jgi:hypothetical protein
MSKGAPAAWMSLDGVHGRSECPGGRSDWGRRRTAARVVRREGRIREAALGRGQIDVVGFHVLPRILGDGTRRYDVAGRSVRTPQNLGRR